MSYSKTNWTSTTPIDTEHLQKIENGIEAAANAVDTITADRWIFSRMSSNPVSTGTQSINAGANWTPPAGVYQFFASPLLSYGELIPIFLDANIGGWGNLSHIGGALVVCDGTNIRINNQSGTTVTVSYMKF